MSFDHTLAETEWQEQLQRLQLHASVDWGSPTSFHLRGASKTFLFTVPLLFSGFFIYINSVIVVKLLGAVILCLLLSLLLSQTKIFWIS